jgi:hypothetical protein
MAKQIIIDEIIKVFSRLGGNVGDVLGTRSNINFLGVGKNTEPFLDQRLNTEALGVLSQSKAIDEAKGAVGFAVSDKLNDIQAGNLLQNLKKMEEFYLPPVSPANITDLGTGTRNLDAEGLASLRDKFKVDNQPFIVPDEPVDLSKATINPVVRGDVKIDDFKKIQTDLRVNPKIKSEEIDTTIAKVTDDVDLPPPGSRGGPEDIAAPVMNVEDIMTMQGKGGIDFIDFVRRTDPEGAAKLQKEVDRLNAASDAADARFAIANMPDAPSKRASAREFLNNALKEDDILKTNLNSVVSAEDVKYITEGGGGIMGDPLILVEKYFGPRILESLPSGGTAEEIAIFTRRVMNNVEDASGFKPDDPRFDRFTARFIDEVQDFARGGLAKILEV